MPHATADDGVRLYYEESGAGVPVIFVHEYAGDHGAGNRSCAISATATAPSPTMPAGYPPSDVPADPAAYYARSAPPTISLPC